MHLWNKILKDLATTVSKAAGVKIEAQDFTTPPDTSLGDIALGCFKLAKELKKNPADIAKDLAAKIKISPVIEKAAAAGPYLNLTLSAHQLVDSVVCDVEKQKEKYGLQVSGAKRQLMFEYAQPNTHKEIHVGHLRNLLIGSALVRILKMTGWQVIAASYHGDIGAHVAKCLWHMATRRGVVSSPEELTPQAVQKILKSVKTTQKNGRYLGQLYAEASKLLEEKPELKSQVEAVQQKLEAGDKAWAKLWAETRKWSLKEMAEIFKELDVKIDRRYLESELVLAGQNMVDELLKKKIAKHSEGAIIVDLEEKKLGVFLIRRSDGTALYATKDLALARLKQKEYPKVKRSLLLVDRRQELYFKQLFETLRRLGFKHQMEYAGYEFVTLKTGAMASREGNVVTWQSFRDEVLARAASETKKRHSEWSKKKIEEISRQIALGAIKFGMLKQDNDKILMFDLEQALAFEGDTGPYIQYAAARLNSILRKAGKSSNRGAVLPCRQAGRRTPEQCQPEEKRLALVMAKFPQMVEQAALEFRPALIARWCLEMANRSNEFYHEVKVLESEPDMRQARLRLAASAKMVLGLGLNLLGITVPQEM
jgi:arginyl-tRNA synthetase